MDQWEKVELEASDSLFSWKSFKNPWKTFSLRVTSADMDVFAAVAKGRESAAKSRSRWVFGKPYFCPSRHQWTRFWCPYSLSLGSFFCSSYHDFLHAAFRGLDCLKPRLLESMVYRPLILQKSVYTLILNKNGPGVTQSHVICCWLLIPWYHASREQNGFHIKHRGVARIHRLLSHLLRHIVHHVQRTSRSAKWHDMLASCTRHLFHASVGRVLLNPLGLETTMCIHVHGSMGKVGLEAFDSSFNRTLETWEGWRLTCCCVWVTWAVQFEA